MEQASRVQILAQSVAFTFAKQVFEKDMNPSMLHPRRIYEKENTEFQIVKEAMGNYFTIFPKKTQQDFILYTEVPLNKAQKISRGLSNVKGDKKREDYDYKQDRQ